MGRGNIEDHMIHDGIWDIVNDFHMGVTNELCSEKYDISRQDQDLYAAESYRRALEAIRLGKFKDEIVPVIIPQRKGDPVVFDQDECPRETPLKILSNMKPVFQKHGKGTAGNSSIVSDGAAVVVVMSKDKAKEMGCTIMATIGAQAAYGVDLKDLLAAPIWAIPKCLKKEGISIDDVDLYEINEAFSGSTVAVLRELGLDHAKVNVNGGSVALGHPIGASGCRVLVTLLHEMIRQDKKIGVASLCLGGGEAVAMVVKR
jgi:acetyl-CoA C-acetyltransferase